MTRKRNSKGRFTTSDEVIKREEIISFILPNLRTLLNYLITILILAPWLFVMFVKFDLKDKVVSIFKNLFDNNATSGIDNNYWNK